VAESAHDVTLMRAAATQVEDAVGTIRGYQSQMDSYHSQLMSNWVGPAATKFSGAFTEFTNDFANVLSALQDIHDKLVASGSTYATTEDANTSDVGRISSVLNL
jgi:WXG100 family type VII secretion target